MDRYHRISNFKSLFIVVYLCMGLVTAEEKISQTKDNPNSVKVETQITAVTVYRDRAQVTRSFDKDLSRGKYTLIFDQLPGHIDQDSIQINGSGSIVIIHF